MLERIKLSLSVNVQQHLYVLILLGNKYSLGTQALDVVLI